MKNRFVNFILLIISVGLFFGMVYVFFIDTVFFLTKKETAATVVSVTKSNKSGTYHIVLKYFNDYTNEVVVCTYKARPHFGRKMINKEKEKIQIHYGKMLPKSIYIIDDRSPRVLILLFEMLFIIMMVVSAWSCLSVILHKKSIPSA